MNEKARYSVIGATSDQVMLAGGTDVKEAPNTGIIFATMSPQQAEALRKTGARVEPVRLVKTSVMPPTPVGAVPTYSPEELNAIAGFEDARKLTEPPLYGAGFNLAFIDSGIRETHEKINGRVVYRKNYTSSPMEDQFNHGTGTCSVALAVAPQCNILNLKVLDDKGSGTEEEVVLAIDDCIAMRDEGSSYAPHVINMSLGTPDTGDPNDVMRVACRAAIEKGIWLSAAAGNSGPTPGTILSPGCEKYVFATGSAKYLPEEKSFVVSNFSSRGPTLEGLVKPDAVMFGEDIVVASSESDTATIAKSGTSFSAPFSSGIAILYFEGTARVAYYTAGEKGAYPGFYPPGTLTAPVTMQDLIDKWLPVFCIKPSEVAQGKDDDYGYGLPFGPLALQVITGQLRPTTQTFLGIMSAMAIMMFMIMIGMVWVKD